MHKRTKATIKSKKTVMKMYNSQCVLCGKPACDSSHILTRGAHPAFSAVPSNQVAMCRTCHIEFEQIPGTSWGEMRIEYLRANTMFHRETVDNQLNILEMAIQERKQ